jgi:hypothetical protein
MRCAARATTGTRAALALAALAVLGGCREDEGEGEDETAAEASTGAEASGGDTGGSADDTGSEGTAGDDMGPWTSLDERPCPDDSFLTYESFGGPFMLSYCTTCHASRLPADMRQGSPIGVDFDDIDDVRTWADRIWIRAADQNLSMPPVGPPGDDERRRLGEWLACGAPTAADLGM